MKSEGVHYGSGFYLLQDSNLILTITELGLYRGHEYLLSTKWTLCDKNQVHNQTGIISNDRFLAYIYIYIYTCISRS